MKVGLYSVTYLGIWYQGGALEVAELFAKAREMGYSGVELDGKRPHANPMDLDAKARAELKRVSLGEGTEICAVAANNDFTSPVSEHLECQLLMARELVRLAADLGAPVVRLFAAWPGVTVRGLMGCRPMTSAGGAGRRSGVTAPGARPGCGPGTPWPNWPPSPKPRG